MNHDRVSDPDDLPMPLPLEIVSDDEALEGFFPDGADPDPATPLGAAYIWWIATSDAETNRPTLDWLSLNPAVWDGYHKAGDDLHGWSLARGIIQADGEPERLAYAKLVPDTGTSVRAFDDIPLEDVYILTLVACTDGIWRVWGLSRNYLPPASRVFADEL